MKIHICDKCRNEIKPYNPDDKEGTAYYISGSAKRESLCALLRVG